MKKTIKITKEEMDILKSAESGKFLPSENKKRSIAQYSKIARATSSKNKTISIRISENDLMKLKAVALQEGLPYQTLISSSLHKLTNGMCESV